jgi:hypothetical protein
LNSQVGALSGALDPKWVRKQLKSGEFIFLLDGYDEVGEQKREDIAEWIVRLSESFPKANFLSLVAHMQLILSWIQLLTLSSYMSSRWTSFK